MDLRTLEWKIENKTDPAENMNNMNILNCGIIRGIHTSFLAHIGTCNKLYSCRKAGLPWEQVFTYELYNNY